MAKDLREIHLLTEHCALEPDSDEVESVTESNDL
jgi:hypothetical protein